MTNIKWIRDEYILVLIYILNIVSASCGFTTLAEYVSLFSRCINSWPMIVQCDIITALHWRLERTSALMGWQRSPSTRDIGMTDGDTDKLWPQQLFQPKLNSLLAANSAAGLIVNPEFSNLVSADTVVTVYLVISCDCLIHCAQIALQIHNLELKLNGASSGFEQLPVAWQRSGYG